MLGVMTLTGLIVFGIGLIAKNRTIHNVGAGIFLSGASRYLDNNPILHFD